MGKGHRLAYYEIPSLGTATVKLFDGRVFDLRFGRAIERDTGKILGISNIYYRIRSILDSNEKLIAKRSHISSELKIV